VSMAGTVTRGSRQAEREPRRWVLLLSDSAGLAAVLSRLLDPADRLSRLGSLRELVEARGLDDATAVVLDLPPGARPAALVQVRRHYLGPLVVLTARGEGGQVLRPDDACTLLARPFSAEAVAAALAGPSLARPPAPTPGKALTLGKAPAPARAPARAPGRTPAGELVPATPGAGTAADPKSAARKAPIWPSWPAMGAARPAPDGIVERGRRLLVALTQGWQARRRVRVAGFSLIALVAFTVAFALAAAQGRCGPGCDALGAVFSPAPIIAPAESRAPSTSRPKRTPASTAAPGGVAGTGAYRGVPGVLATTTTRQATTTTRRTSPGGGPGPTTPSTRPATTQTTAATTTTGPTVTTPTTPTTETTLPLPGP
jgi:hypothetical protein